jgi:hypothetical protein
MKQRSQTPNQPISSHSSQKGAIASPTSNHEEKEYFQINITHPQEEGNQIFTENLMA